MAIVQTFSFITIFNNLDVIVVTGKEFTEYLVLDGSQYKYLVTCTGVEQCKNSGFFCKYGVCFKKLQ